MMMKYVDERKLDIISGKMETKNASTMRLFLTKRVAERPFSLEITYRAKFSSANAMMKKQEHEKK